VAKTQRTAPVSVEHIAQSILVFRGHKVLLDAELAALYGVSTARLNQQVRRNLERFPVDFMFQLSTTEYAALMLQNAISKRGHGGRRKLPLVFTEHGAIMAAAVLNSPRAVEMSLYVVRAFVKLRQALASNKELTQKLDQLERKLQTHDQAIVGILKAIRELMNPPESERRGIGFTADLEKKS
jgi:ORF6N domain